MSLYSAASANSGDLDPSFGTSGLVITNANAVISAAAGDNQANAVALQTDGKIVAVGVANLSLPKGGIVFTVIRYNTDGTRDTSFGTGGVVTTDFSTIHGPFANSTAYAVALQTDGKIVAAGSTVAGTEVFALARYNTNGTLDGSFGTGGLVVTDFAAVLSLSGTSSVARGVTIDTTGNIIAAGYSNVGAGGTNFALARYTTNGTRDITFGTNGLVLTNFGSTLSLGTSSDHAYAVALQTDGKIVAAGTSTAGGNTSFALARYNINGTLDNTFGTNGLVLTNFGIVLSLGTTTDQANAVAIQSDGKIIAGGYSTESAQRYFALARYNTNGTLDTTFGTNGLVTTSFYSVLSIFPATSPDNQITGLALLPDDRIVAGGFFEDKNSHYFFALAQYTATGNLDAMFGTSGLVLTDFNMVLSIAGSPNDKANGIVRQPDGKIVAAGSYFNNATSHTFFGLARYLNPPPPPFISDSVICTPCGPIALGKRGCMRSMIFNRGGKCVERAFGKFKQVESFDTSCQDILATFTVCDCAPVLT